MTADEIPQFFLMKVTDERGTYYVLSHSLVAVPEGSLPPAVETAVNEQIRLAADKTRAEVCEIPPESGGTWMALASMI